MQALATLSFSAPTQLWAGFRNPVMYKRPAKPIWKDTVIAINARGNEESFSIGPDGFVWSYEIGNDKRKAGRLVSTGLQATSFAVSSAANGSLVVVAVDGLALRTTLENKRGADHRWAAPKLASIPMGPDALYLDKVFTKNEDGNLFVGVTVCYTNAQGQMMRKFWHGVWAGRELICGHHPMHYYYVNEFWFETFCASGHLDALIA